VGGVQPRKEVVQGAAPWFFFDDFLSIFGKKILVLTDRILENTEFQNILSQRDRETQYFEAVSSKGKG